MCGGFYCSRNSLLLLNLVYIVVGGLLIGCAVYGNRFTDLPILPSLIGCGIVLIFLALCGLYGAAKHHQVTLFFYMIILFCLFIVQFAVACSCLAVNKHQQRIFAEEAWDEISDSIKGDVQTTFNCCGFNSTAANDHPSCDAVNKICCPAGSAPGCACSPCLPKLEDTIDNTFFVTGSIGLFFSFTEIIAVFIAKRFRNQRDPIYDLPVRAVFPKANSYEYC